MSTKVEGGVLDGYVFRACFWVGGVLVAGLEDERRACRDDGLNEQDDECVDDVNGDEEPVLVVN